MFSGTFSDDQNTVTVLGDSVVITSTTSDGIREEHRYSLQDVIVKGIIEHGILDLEELAHIGYDKMQIQIQSTGEVFEFRGFGVQQYCDGFISYLNDFPLQ